MNGFCWRTSIFLALFKAKSSAKRKSFRICCKGLIDLAWFGQKTCKMRFHRFFGKFRMKSDGVILYGAQKITISPLLRYTGPVRLSRGPSPRWIRVTPGWPSDTGPRSRSRRIRWNPGILLLLLPSGIKVRPPTKLLYVYSFPESYP